LHKTLIFLTYFAIVALRDSCGDRSQHPLHVANKQQHIGFTTFLTPSLGATWGTERNITNCKTSTALHGSAPAKKKTGAALHGNAFAVWMLQMSPPKKALLKQPKTIYFKLFLVFFDSHTKCISAGRTHIKTNATLRGSVICFLFRKKTSALAPPNMLQTVCFKRFGTFERVFGVEGGAGTGAPDPPASLFLTIPY
jgi:hypothetical protein